MEKTIKITLLQDNLDYINGEIIKEVKKLLELNPTLTPRELAIYSNTYTNELMSIIKPKFMRKYIENGLTYLDVEIIESDIELYLGMELDKLVKIDEMINAIQDYAQLHIVANDVVLEEDRIIVIPKTTV